MIKLSCENSKGLFIKYVQKIFRKTKKTKNVRVRIRGLEIIVFREILRT